MNPEFFFQRVIGMVDSTKNRVVVLDPQGAVKYNVMGYPAILDGNLSSEEILFGDLKAYKFNFAKAVEVRKSEEAEFRKGSKVYRAMTLADGNLGDLNAIVRCVATT
jgi:HK97 family phage major capsid protein